MDLRDFIEQGEKATKTGRALAGALGVHPNVITSAKAGGRGLPNYACVILANIIKEDERKVIAASELVTEKKEERRAVWLPYLDKAASVLMMIALGFVTTVVSPSPAEASTRLDSTAHAMCIMSNYERTHCLGRSFLTELK